MPEQKWRHIYPELVVEIVDDYLGIFDSYSQGNDRFMDQVRKGKERFEAALTKLLLANDLRAPSRLVFYEVVQVGGVIELSSELGKAAAQFLGPRFPVCTEPHKGIEFIFAGDLYFWWLDHAKNYAKYPPLQFWMERETTRKVAIPMYQKSCWRNAS